MPVPTAVTDLSTTASSNSPAGSDSPTDGDNYIRALSQFIRELYNRVTDGLGAITCGAFTANGNVVLGNAAADTLNVGDGGIIKDASGNVGIGITPTAKLDISGNYALIRNGSFTLYWGDGSTLVTGGASNEGALRSDSGPLKLAISTNTRFAIESDGRLYGTAMHNTGTVTGTAKQYLASGTYTPTITGVSNVASSTARLSTWMRVGNVVTVAGQFDLTPTTTGQTLFGMSLPIASALTTAFQLGGTAVAGWGISGRTAQAYSDATNDRAQFEFNSSAGSLHTFAFTFTYEVL